jgi:hypothetical protein
VQGGLAGDVVGLEGCGGGREVFAGEDEAQVGFGDCGVAEGEEGAEGAD